MYGINLQRWMVRFKTGIWNKKVDVLTHCANSQEQCSKDVLPDNSSCPLMKFKDRVDRLPKVTQGGVDAPYKESALVENSHGAVPKPFVRLPLQESIPVSHPKG